MPWLSKALPRPTVTPKPGRPIRWATLIMAVTVIVAALVVVAWFAGEDRTTAIFTQLQVIQNNPPLWARVPVVAGQYLLAPTVVLFLAAYGITRLSPRPRPWSRCVVIAILLTLVLRYVLWRCLSTLNLSTPLNGSFSLGLLGLELFGLSTSIIQLVLLLRFRDRQGEADQLEQDVLEQKYRPGVDVFIPSYNEPAFILRRTIIGCQAMDYAPKTVYLLDDTHRPEIKALAAELGCEYIARPDNHHAKAGNLNHAIGLTQGELIACFDADFVPNRNFLSRTLGFFQNSQVGMVQTPQSFYNADPIARNLGLEGILTPEEEVFYRQIQPMRDGAGSVVCSGTSFVVRRRALEESGQFVTESLSEDYFTAVRLAASGSQVIYLDEKLSAGLAAEDMAAHATQKLRWARGTLQAFFIDSNPLTIPGLNLFQRLGHLEGLLHWFNSIPRMSFLLMPLAYSFLNVIPIEASSQELLYFFLPYYLVQLTVFAWLNDYSRSALLSDIYSLVLIFPVVATVIQAMIRPFGQGFTVTPKGTSSHQFQFNWGLAWPLMALFGLTAISLWRNLGLCLTAGWGDAYTSTYPRGLALGWIWSTYNLVMVGIALLTLLDVPRPDPHIWFDLRRVIKLSPQGAEGAEIKPLWGVTTRMSEVGLEVALTQQPSLQIPLGVGTAVNLTIAEADLTLEGLVMATGQNGEFASVQVQFQNVPLASYRTLVETLFCRPGQWKRWDSPGELQSLGLLASILFRPRLLGGKQSPKVLPVAQG